MLSFNYKCSQCCASYEIDPELMLCPICSSKNISGQPLNGVLEVELSGTLDSNDSLDYLPIERKYFPSIPVGNTPLWHPAPEIPTENISKKIRFPRIVFER